MNTWADDFSYNFYGQLIQSARSFLEPRLLREAANVDFDRGDHLFLRHDIDCSLDAAMRMAEFEATMRVRSTYHLMMHSKLYDASRSAIPARIAALGHEVGVHFHCPAKYAPRGAMLPRSNP